MDRGEKIALALKDGLGKILSGCQPELKVVVAPVDVTKGKFWFQKVGDDLSKAEAAIVCLTPESVDSKWIHFEVGAVARNCQENIFPYLVDVRPETLEGPLASYQGSLATAADTRALVRDLVGVLGLRKTDWEKKFSDAWDKTLEPTLKEIRSESLGIICPDARQAFRRKTFEEDVDRCMNQRWVERYVGVNKTLDLMKDYERALGAGRGVHPDLERLRKLIAGLEDYAMIIHGSMLVEPRYKIREDGTLDLPEGLALVTRERLGEIRTLVEELFPPKRASSPTNPRPQAARLRSPRKSR
jgi:hypothetical protein